MTQASRGRVASPVVVRLALRVRFCETDLMGIVHHANYLQYFEAGRVEWLRQKGVSYDAWMRRGLQLPVVEARVRYKKAARFDDELVVETSVGQLGGATVRFEYRITRGAQGEDVICDGDTLLACVGANLAPKRLPKDVVTLLLGGAAEGGATADEGPGDEDDEKEGE